MSIIHFNSFSNFDPVVDTLEKAFGQGVDKWAINIVLVALAVYTFIKKK
jgi:hypothetical protein